MLVQLGVPLLLGAWEEEQGIGLGLLQVKGGGRRPMSKVNLKETDRPVYLGDPGYKGRLGEGSKHALQATLGC